MKVIKSDCFAYYEEEGKCYCNAINKIACKDCPFYKNREDIVNNLFYKWSFDSNEDYKKAKAAYKEKYGDAALREAIKKS